MRCADFRIVASGLSLQDIGFFWDGEVLCGWLAGYIILIEGNTLRMFSL